MSPVWNPAQYGKFAAERGRPFADLVSRIGSTDARLVVDLGCGPGNLTATLLDRWPAARIRGVDSSAEMIEAAAGFTAGRLTFEVADLRDWITAAPAASVDVVVSNATLQWVPDQREVLPGLVSRIRPGGWLAVQIPGNHDEPAHAILRELAGTPPYAEHTAAVATRPVLPGPVEYVELLSAAGCTVDAWETTYIHVLQGPDAVLEWIKGTGARPVLQALPDDLRPAFEEEYAARLREAYPERDHGTLLPFRRVFAVARREESR